MVSKKSIDKSWDEIQDNPLVIASRLRKNMSDAKTEWQQECEDFVNDEDFNHVLNVVNRLMNGDHPDADKVGPLIVKLEAYAVKFRMQYNAYMSYKKGTTESNAKKNHYYSMVSGIERLCDGLKYLTR